jgi:DNA helicase-2/ATP-dependent DNA helicase PcrA
MKSHFQQYYRELKEFVDSCQNQKGLVLESWDSYFNQLPELYQFCYNIATSGKIDNNTLKRLYTTIEYLISPLDYMPELIYGPEGFNEDIYFIALTLKDVCLKIPEELIDQYWKFDIDITAYADNVFLLACSELPTYIQKSIGLFYEDYESPCSPEEIYNMLISETSQEEISAKSFLKVKDSDNSQDAINHTEGPCIVFAGPGSGKTWIIEERVFNLINNLGIPSENILITTFTNKAADELTVRLKERFASRNDVDKIISALTISTIHSFCFSLLKQYQHRILFLKETYSPADEGDQMLFIYRHSGERYLDIKRFYTYWQNSRTKAGENRFNLGLFDYYTEVLQIYNFLSEEILGSDNKTQLDFFRIIKAKTTRCFEDNIIATYPKYWQLLLENGMMDQSIILSYTEAILKYDQVLNEVRKKYKYILVDEYQDTNPIQERIFRHICSDNGNLFVVGDDDQSIYRFRGAEVTNITKFTDRHPHSLIVRLNENRRSSKKIVEITKKLIEHNTSRIKKSLFSNHEEGNPVSLVVCENEQKQAEKAAELILGLQADKQIQNLSQVAILFRSVKTLGPKFKKVFKENNIECTIASDKSFFIADEIKGLIQVLSFLESENLDIKGRNYLLFFRKAGINDKEEMHQKIELWHKKVQENFYKSLLELYYSMLHEINILKKLGNDETSLGNLGIFSELLASFEGGQSSQVIKEKLEFFLQYCEMLDGGVDQAELETADAVQLMTIHKSKGLQFDYVIIANVTNEHFPMRYRPGPRQRARGVILIGPEGRNYDMEEEKKCLEEERRILYVGMTRAAKGIFLLTEEAKISTFIQELGDLNIMRKEPYRLVNNTRKIRSSMVDVLHVSHSEIYDYRYCPGRYNFNRRYRFKGQAIKPLFSGLSLHRSLEVLHRMLLDDQRINTNILNRIFDRCWTYPFGSETEMENERERNSQIFIDYAEVLLRKNGKHRILQTEYPFMTSRGKNVLTGKLDLVQEDENGQLEIVEFKYNRNMLLESYAANQLHHYSLAYPQQEVLLSVYYLKERAKENIKSIGKEEILMLLDDDFRKIRNKEFDRTSEKIKCRICPVAIVCGERSL